MTLLYRQTPTWFITGTESTSDTDSENTGCETTESESVEDDESEDDGILRDSTLEHTYNARNDSLDLQEISYSMPVIYHER